MQQIPGRRWRLWMVAAASASALFAQQQNGPTAIAPARSQQSAGLSPRSIGLSPSSIGLSPSSIGLSPSPLRPTPALTAPPVNRVRPLRPPRDPNGTGRHGTLPYAFVGAPLFLPNVDASYAAETPPEAAAPPAEQSDLSDQIKRLTTQIQDLQDQINRGSAPQPPIAAENEEPDTAAMAPPISIVTKNGQTIETGNYAVIGGMFWDLSSEPARKIQLTSIDIAASRRATEAHGAEFPAIATVR